MGWKPQRDSEPQGSAAEATPTPAPRRRRARVAAGTGTKAPVRPAGGGNNQSGYGRDDRPRDITVRLGKRWSEIVRDIKAGEYSWGEFVANLDEEELARGQLKDKNGGFGGRPPTMVPRDFHLACQRELERRFRELFSQDVIKVTKMYIQMAQSATIKDETKAKMLQYCMERVFGGIPKDVTIRQEAPWEQVIVNVMGEDGDHALPSHLKNRYAGYAERQGSTDEGEEGA